MKTNIRMFSVKGGNMIWAGVTGSLNFFSSGRIILEPADVTSDVKQPRLIQ